MPIPAAHDPAPYDPEARPKAIRLMLEHRDDYPREWAAITTVSNRLGMKADTLDSFATGR